MIPARLIKPDYEALILEEIRSRLKEGHNNRSDLEKHQKKRFYPSGQCSTVLRCEQSLRTVAWLNFASVNGIVQERESLDVIRNKGYNSRMMTYATLQSDRREFLALTGLTLQEFQLLLNAFTPAYERRYPKDRTLADRPRQRCAGGGRKGVLDCPEQKLLFLLVYLKTYPLQVLMGELFGLSQPGVNYWIHRLLPVLRDALDSLSVLPERNPNDFARSQTATGTEPRLIIDGTERRRQRPKSPEKQALHYSGKKKAHTDKNVVIVDLRRKCIGFLSRTYVGKTHDKKIADSEGISYPPKAELLDSGEKN